jgi:hypothetical protein
VLPDRPGLGWELDEDYIDAHRIETDRRPTMHGHA